MPLVTASRFSPDTLLQAKDYFLPLLLCIVVTGSLSLLNGYIIHKLAKIDAATSFLGCIPGAGPSLVAMSEQMGADAIAVAVLQYLRILMVSIIIPLIATFFLSGMAPSGKQFGITTVINNRPSLPPLLNICLVAILLTASVWLAKRISIPSNLFLVPFFFGLLVFILFPYQIQIPTPIFRGALFFLGLSIGLKFETETAQKLLNAVLLEVVLVLLLIFACFLTGHLFHLITHIDPLTALLGSTPGGITAMMATVVELGGDCALVLTMQMTRMLLILILSPFLASYLLKGRFS
ncbi:MAG: AbrB family transcriptional regulator [Geminocystis sp.]|nr:AbrB family transcriptional regulator [Geminocystis sp.]